MNIEQKQPVFSSELSDLLKFNEFINKFRRMRRLIWYRGNRARELNGDHCFHLAMIAWFLNERMCLNLKVNKIVFYALVHDLLEIYAGDPPNVPAHLEGKYGPPRDGKEEREAKALIRIEKEWGEKFPSLLKWIKAYEAQEDVESCFVMAVDKLMSQVNVYQDHGRTDKKIGVPLSYTKNLKRKRILDVPAILALFDELHVFWEQDLSRQYQP